MCLQSRLPLLPNEPPQLRSGARHSLDSSSRFAKLPLLLVLTLGPQVTPGGNPTRLMPVLLELNELRRKRFMRSELERTLDLAHDSGSP